MISAIVLSHNDDNTINSCLLSLLWCDEILVVDDYSRDKTMEIVENLCRSHPGKIRITQHALAGNFSAQRNFGLAQARGEWVLFIDADEQVPAVLQSEIEANLAKVGESVQAFVFRRKDFFCGRWLQHGEIGHYRAVRLARRQAGVWKKAVHETWETSGIAVMLYHPLEHYPHPSVSTFLAEINYYTDLRSQDSDMKKKKITFWKILLYPVGKFMYTYLWQGGFLDGIPGLILAGIMSFHSFLVRAKTWQKQQVR